MNRLRCEGIFHVHSDFSADGGIGLAELKRLCLERDLRFLILTDHAEDVMPDRAEEYISSCANISDQDFMVVPGLEFRHPENRSVHILIIGWEKYLDRKSPDLVLEQMLGARNGELIVLAHPGKSGYKIPSGLEQAIHGIETWNAACDSRYLPNRDSLRIFRSVRSVNPDLIGLGGLDLHDKPGFRGVRIRMRKQFANSEDLVQSIRSGGFTTLGPCWKMRSSPDYGQSFLGVLYIARQIIEAADAVRRRMGI